jgi:hypothetical protein
MPGREVLELAEKVRDWRFTLDQRQRVEFAAAMALENLGDTAKSRPLWARLAADFSLPPARRAVAMYYQAKEAKAKNDAEKILVFAQEAVNLLRETKTDPEKAPTPSACWSMRPITLALSRGAQVGRGIWGGPA